MPDLAENGVLGLTAEDALAVNKTIPISDQPIEAANALVLSAYVKDPQAISRAQKCLADAIYYEAGFQAVHEQRAVAQVVLNRVRHPAFPSSVCEVIYEGSYRKTGCQFTFTCDGSLRRRPQESAWLRSETVANNALAGVVEESVGMATHYHADYVVPRWAFELTKIRQVGRHIFYRWNGAWGRRAAFKYSPTNDPSVEEILGLTGEVPSAENDDTFANHSPLSGSGLIVDSSPRTTPDTQKGLASDAQKGVPIADTSAGTLRVDQDGALID
ncbi:cell wall hydrolase [Qipengyuania sphaerica]|uniref:cell wall hydrolase n=1 Tax=Qipengyuania sphaerica TaxID=2867243 RepID=UPI001FFCC7F4|nr:cell wall hydrolase [Qipengyuania sphaerica]